MPGWIKIHRDIRSWEWWDDLVMVKSWFTILMLANSCDRKWHGYEIKAGSFITSRERLADELGLSVDKTRTVLARLKKTGEISVITSNQFTLITINNWKQYQVEENPQPQFAENQDDNSVFEKEIPSKSPTNPQQIPNESPANPHKQEYKEMKEIECLNTCSNPDTDLFGGMIETKKPESCLSFEAFWNLYQKKVGKQTAKNLFKKTSEDERQAIRQHVPLYVQATPEVRYRKDPTTYLRQKCWEDEIIVRDSRNVVNRDEEGF